MMTESMTERCSRCSPAHSGITDERNGVGGVYATVTMRVFGKLQLLLLPLHVSHYSWSFGAYSHFGCDFIRSMRLFWHPLYAVCVRGEGGELLTVVMHVWLAIFFSSSYPHSMHIAVILLAHPAACV